MKRIFIIAAILISITSGTAYIYFGMLSHKSPEQFALIPDLPLDDRNSRFSTENPGTGQSAHDRIRASVRQRLLAAYRTLAYADSGKWSLATWAQLQWVRDTLDGEGLQEIEVGAKVDPSLQDFSFVRLLNELVKTASFQQKRAAMDARRDGIAIIEELREMTPNTKEPTATLKHVVLEIESAPGLHPFVTDFPPFKNIPPPADD